MFTVRFHDPESFLTFLQANRDNLTRAVFFSEERGQFSAMMADVCLILDRDDCPGVDDIEEAANQLAKDLRGIDFRIYKGWVVTSD